MLCGQRTGNLRRSGWLGLAMAFTEMSSALSGTSTTDHSLTWPVMPYVTSRPSTTRSSAITSSHSSTRPSNGSFAANLMHFILVADVACGTGTFVRYLYACFLAVVYRVERSPEMLGTNRARRSFTSVRNEADRVGVV